MNDKDSQDDDPPCSGLVVSLNHFEQYGPDGYENVIKTLIVHRETTVGEIIDWARKVTGAEKTGWPFTGPVHLAASDISHNAPLIHAPESKLETES